MKKTILFIHGMWGGDWYFEPFGAYFHERGYNCETTNLRYHKISPDEDPPDGLGNTSILDYVSDLERLIGTFDEKPVVIGHSMGGLLTQKLAAKGLAEAAVLLCPASPAGIMAMRPSVIKSFRSTLLRWKFWSRPHRPTFEEAVYSMLHLLPPEQQKETYERFVYESGRAAWEIGMWWMDKKRATAVDEREINVPLLVIGSSEDRITPVSVVRKVAKKYGEKATYKEFPGHAHWIMQEPGWEEVAGYIYNWLIEKGKKPEA